MLWQGVPHRAGGGFRWTLFFWEPGSPVVLLLCAMESRSKDYEWLLSGANFILGAVLLFACTHSIVLFEKLRSGLGRGHGCMPEALCSFLLSHKPVAHSYDARTWGHPCLHRPFKASLDDRKPCLKIKTNETKAEAALWMTQRLQTAEPGAQAPACLFAHDANY